MSTTLPGLDCGLCGSRTCEEFASRLDHDPKLVDRCIHLSENRVGGQPKVSERPSAPAMPSCDPRGCVATCGAASASCKEERAFNPWHDSLGREFDFYLEHFPEDPGPREVILPHNPIITRELDIQVGDIMIGRPLGMSCGCPITHCGVATEVDKRTGVMTWCVTGPLGPRQHGYKDIGYYAAEAYEGLVKDTRVELKIGMRHYFQPRMCMLQWRHSGLINYINRLPEGYQIRLEGLFIG